MSDVARQFLELPWPVVAVGVAFGFGVLGILLVSLFTLGIYLITRVPPFAWVLRRSLWGMVGPIQDYAESRVRDIVNEELQPIRDLVMPGNPASLTDRLERVERMTILTSEDHARSGRDVDVLRNRLDRFDERLRSISDRAKEEDHA